MKCYYRVEEKWIKGDISSEGEARGHGSVRGAVTVMWWTKLFYITLKFCSLVIQFLLRGISLMAIYTN